MCYPSPGPRCSAHTKSAYQRAKKAFDLNPSPENKVRRDRALTEFLKSPEGVGRLRTMAENETNSARKESLLAQADANEISRIHKLDEYKSRVSYPESSMSDGINLDEVNDSIQKQQTDEEQKSVRMAVARREARRARKEQENQERAEKARKILSNEAKKLGFVSIMSDEDYSTVDRYERENNIDRPFNLTSPTYPGPYTMKDFDD